ncbi:hypothetical protein OAA00_02895 [Cyclobacteriaceae bacterium]|nr:hypothetical protein [Cyclobacteriaceae bacterium]MDB4315177.1 hypothetical protein [Cyclobacteriaceae bacterium]MDB4742290.1 hypothetical protein [Cyclobacteriaceae bacterium]MDB9883971.1 hypothetical protein [Cyclobacteriaceae bacterium]MDC1369711.1 hypothetical protein [Cyclobacteriaceae bacterium]
MNPKLIAYLLLIISIVSIVFLLAFILDAFSVEKLPILIFVIVPVLVIYYLFVTRFGKGIR